MDEYNEINDLTELDEQEPGGAANARDHRVIGRRLGMYLKSERIGAGLILWSPKGARLRMSLERFGQEAHIKNGYEWVYTPHIGRARLWEISGHLENFKDMMYAPIEIDNESYYLKPMNCPFHIEIYNSELRSYRDLPLRLAEYGTVYRYELSGVLSGLTRVRGFTQDDAHIICEPGAIGVEVAAALKFSLYILRSFGLNDFKAYISTKPEKKSIGGDEDWERATDVLRRAVTDEGLEFETDEGGGAFYGPKIDLKLLDAAGREWQCSTIQFDFNLPERFGMSYIARDGKKRTPVMIHRALFGSVERFAAVLIEHYNGEFPLWFAPLQIGVVPVSVNHSGYAEKLRDSLLEAGFRAKADVQDAHMREKIKSFELERVPYIFIAGDRDIKAGGFSVRCREKGDLGFMDLPRFMEHVKDELLKGTAKKIMP